MDSRSLSSPDKINGQALAKQKLIGEKSKWPKSDVRHWRDRIFRNSYTRGGERFEVADWCVRFSFQGRRETINLETPNAAAAASRALKMHRQLIGAGWEALLCEARPGKPAPPAPAPPEAATVGRLIEVAMRKSSARAESLDAYSKALRRIVAGALGMDSPDKFSKSGGSAAWRAAIDAVPLDLLTPAVVLEWKNAYLRAAAGPQERNAAAVTVNSLLRNSKALLSKRIRPFLEKEMVLPKSLWFDDVPMEKEPSMRYRSRMDAATLLKSAMDELGTEPEPFKALLLTLVCGLRRSEADSVQWNQIDWKEGTLEIRDTDTKRLKSADSAGVIAIDQEVLVIFRRLKEEGKGPFILETPATARRQFATHKSRTYRCDATHARLLAWLRAHGVEGRRPMHTLRKEIGSIIASEQGIFAASRYLRHSDIRITSKLYADSKKPVKAGLGKLFADAVETRNAEGILGQNLQGEKLP